MAEPGVILPDDLRAAVGAGIVGEAQAAALRALASARAAGRAAGREPFELYRGFNEVFIAIGLGLLTLGLSALVPLWQVAPQAGALAAAALHGALAWGLAEYLTGRRRMMLPSIVLVAHLAQAAASAGLAVAPDGPFAALGALGLAAAGFYARFRLPFALLPAGLALLALMLLGLGLIDPDATARLDTMGPAALVDLARGGGFALVTLAFGLGALALALRFDLADPLRLGQGSAAAFWLHLMAAPAIVNTAAFTLWNLDTTGGTLALALFLAAMALFALVIDRRSFLVSGLGYVVALALAGLGGLDWLAAVLLGLGAAIVALGAAWVGARARLMRALPDFPGKDRLPPYATEAA